MGLPNRAWLKLIPANHGGLGIEVDDLPTTGNRVVSQAQCREQTVVPTVSLCGGHAVPRQLTSTVEPEPQAHEQLVTAATLSH